MSFKRALLFLAGLLYGIVINGAVLGIAYGLYAAGFVGLKIFGKLIDSTLLSIWISNEAAIFFLLCIAAVMACAAAIGFVGGVIYGAVQGAWHCAMDFHNNGFLRGLSSPFRFLHAKIRDSFYGNKVPLASYYASVDIHFLTQRKNQAESEIQAVAVARVTIIEDLIDQLQTGRDETEGRFETGVLELIAEYDIDLERELSTDPLMRKMASKIEGHALKGGAGLTGAPNKMGDFLREEEAVSIVKNSFFKKESQEDKAKNKEEIRGTVANDDDEHDETSPLLVSPT